MAEIPLLYSSFGIQLALKVKCENPCVKKEKIIKANLKKIQTELKTNSQNLGKLKNNDIDEIIFSFESFYSKKR